MRAIIGCVAILIILLTILVFNGLRSNAQSTDSCTYSSDCHPDQCYETNNSTGLGECHAKRSAVMVWPSRCLSEVKIGTETVLEAPFVNGEPDLSQAKLLHIPVKYRNACGHIELRTR